MKSKRLIQAGTLSLISSLALSLPAEQAVADTLLKISTKGGLKIKTSDGNAAFKAGGRIQWDYDRTEANDVNGTTVSESETFEVRRARLYLKGKVGTWGYKSQFNVGEDDGGTVEDLYIQYLGWGDMAKVTLGRHKEPFGLEQLISSKDISMLERSAITEAYSPGRNGGVQISGKHNNLFYGLGIYRDDASTSDESANERATTGRVAFAPINQPGHLVHGAVAFRDGTEESKMGLELAGVYQGFHAQAEYIESDPEDSTLEDTDGSYLQVGYIINGERPYKDGKFKRVKPLQGATAIEVLARVEEGYGKYSDTGLGSSIVEGEQVSLGINVYPNDNVRLGLSFMDAELDDGSSEGEEVRFRTQFAF